MNRTDLDKILKDHRLWIEDSTNGKIADLSGVDLRYTNLSDANLYGANLRYADLSGADLSDANLYGADLRYTNLSDANLYGSNLRDANLSGVNGILSFNGEKHLLVYFKTYNKYYFKIGCRNLTAKEWLDNFEEIGKKHCYSEKQIEVYGKVIKTFSEIEL